MPKLCGSSEPEGGRAPARPTAGTGALDRYVHSPRKRARLSHPSSQQEAASDAEVPLPTIVDDVDHSDLSVGQSIIAFGRSPNGEWTKFHAVVKAFRERAPHVVVKYTSDLQGNAIRIGLPSPITAYLSRTDIEVMEG